MRSQPETIALEVAHHLLGDGARVVSWELNPVEYQRHNADTQGVHRMDVRGLRSGRPVNASAILKRATGVAGRTELMTLEWIRDRFPGARDAPKHPRLLSTHGSHASESWLWLEFIPSLPGRSVTMNQLREVASELAAWQTSLVLSGAIESDAPSGHDIAHFAGESRLWQRPSGAQSILNQLAEEAQREIGLQLNALLERATAGPVTLCHNDLWHGNLLVAVPPYPPSVYLVDWALAGPGGLAADLAFFVAAAVWEDLPLAADIVLLEDQLWSGYSSGMRAAGATKPMIQTARTTFEAVATVRYGLLAVVAANMSPTDEWVARLCRRSNTTPQTIATRRLRLARRSLELLRDRNVSATR